MILSTIFDEGLWYRFYIVRKTDVDIFFSEKKMTFSISSCVGKSARKIISLILENPISTNIWSGTVFRIGMLDAFRKNRLNPYRSKFFIIFLGSSDIPSNCSYSI